MNSDSRLNILEEKFECLMDCHKDIQDALSNFESLIAHFDSEILNLKSNGYEYEPRMRMELKEELELEEELENE